LKEKKIRLSVVISSNLLIWVFYILAVIYANTILHKHKKSMTQNT
jgi:hypothetical protein